MAMVQKANQRPLVKHVIRQLAAIDGSGSMPYRSPDVVDSDLSSLVLQGYRVVNTHYLGTQTDPTNSVPYYGILYILALEQSEVERAKQNLKEQG